MRAVDKMPHRTLTAARPRWWASSYAINRLAGRLSGLGARDLFRLFVVLSVDRTLEVVESAANRTPHFWQSLWPKHQQRDHENQKQMRWLENVTDHSEETTPCVSGRRRSDPDA